MKETTIEKTTTVTKTIVRKGPKLKASDDKAYPITIYKPIKVIRMAGNNEEDFTQALANVKRKVEAFVDTLAVGTTEN
jgi:hypothetical protein